jgi:hypothetical protein
VADAYGKTADRMPLANFNGRNWATEMKVVCARGLCKLVNCEKGAEVCMTVGNGPAADIRTAIESEIDLMTNPVAEHAPTVRH